MNFNIFQILFLFLFVARERVLGQISSGLGTCVFRGKIYQSNPNVPIVGDTHTCYCNFGRWEKCEKNQGVVVPPSVPSVPKKGQLDTAQSKRNLFWPSDFVFDLKAQPRSSTGLGGEIRPAGVEEFPALKGQGVSFTLFNIKPCGINLPHVHPRATELLYVIKGSKLRTSFVEENGGRTIVNDIREGQVTVFPEGLIHYQQNLGCDDAEYISGLNSEDPGVVTISTRTFTLPTEALQATFGLNPEQVEIIKKGIPAGPAKGRSECLKRCGLFRGASDWEDSANLDLVKEL